MSGVFLLACTAPDDTALPREETLTLASEIAERGKQTWPAEDLPFDWMQTVWGFGLHRLEARSGGQHATYAAWMEHHVGRFEGDEPAEFVSSDSMSPSILASIAMVEDPELELTPITDAAHAYLAIAPRTSAGAIEHWGDGSPFGELGQVWIDSQFMFGVFLLSEHRRTGDEAYLDLWEEQYALFSAHCRDPADQLYRHAWDDVEGANIPREAVYWNRGNSWVLVSAAEFLRLDRSGNGGPTGPLAARWCPFRRRSARARESIEGTGTATPERGPRGARSAGESRVRLVRARSYGAPKRVVGCARCRLACTSVARPAQRCQTRWSASRSARRASRTTTGAGHATFGGVGRHRQHHLHSEADLSPKAPTAARAPGAAPSRRRAWIGIGRSGSVSGRPPQGPFARAEASARLIGPPP